MSYLPLVSDGLLAVGGIGLLSSLSGKYFFLFPIAYWQLKDVSESWTSAFSHPTNYLEEWAFFVFNLTEGETVAESKNWFWYNDVGAKKGAWDSYRWAGKPPSWAGSNVKSGATYGTLGAYAGWVMLGMVVVGAGMKFV